MVEELCYSWKAVGSSPDEVIKLFNLPNPSSNTMALGFTQPVTEMNTRNHPIVKCGWHVRLTPLPPSVSRLSRQYGILNISQPYRPPWPVTAIAFLCFLILSIILAGNRQYNRYILLFIQIFFWKGVSCSTISRITI
jgi:hypothetical protein